MNFDLYISFSMQKSGKTIFTPYQSVITAKKYFLLMTSSSALTVFHVLQCFFKSKNNCIILQQACFQLNGLTKPSFKITSKH